MSTQLNTQELITLLSQSSEQLDMVTVSSLAKMRQKTLSVQPARAPSFVLSSGHWLEHLIPHSTVQWLATAILVVLLSITGATYWQHSVEQQISELDVAILTDELPLEVFVD
jgi:hypothetical protein